MSKRYIDAEEAEKNIRKFLDIQPSELVPKICKKVEDIAVNAVKLTPTADVVEVVRCRDCKHFTKGMAIGMCKRVEEKPIIPCRFDNYCMFGERSKNDGT